MSLPKQPSRMNISTEVALSVNYLNYRPNEIVFVKGGNKPTSGWAFDSHQSLLKVSIVIGDQATSNIKTLANMWMTFVLKFVFKKSETKD